MNRFGVLNLVVAIVLVASSVTDAIDCNSRPDFKNAKDCCPHDEFANNEIMESCKEYLTEDANSPPGGGGGGRGHRGPGGGPGKFHHNTCYGECIMNATGLVNFETMEIDEAKTKTFLSEMFSKAPEFIPVVTDAMTKCAEQGKEIHAKRANDPQPPPSPGGCKPCAAMFMHCVKKETTINCPTSVWKNDETCNNLREFMMVCKPHHGGPPE